jgi:mRNA interferase MazF
LRRPVLVVQSNAFNESNISTVVVVTITSNLALSAAPGNVRINRSDSGLSKASVINVSQVLTLDRNYLTGRVRALPGKIFNEVNNGLRLCLGL